jgi:hypothetical protein
MLMGPPNGAEWPKPMSSRRTITTFGAPFGAFTSKRGGAVALRASTSMMAGYSGSGTGNTVRSSVPAAAGAAGPFAAPLPVGPRPHPIVQSPMASINSRGLHGSNLPSTIMSVSPVTYASLDTSLTRLRPLSESL